MATAINTFRNVRARLNRRGDDNVLTGWVTHLAREEARVRLWNFVPFDAGERVSCECFGQGTVARFVGQVIAQADRDLAINLVGSISYAPSGEPPRIYVAGLRGKLDGPEGGATMEVLDLSPVGLGVLVDLDFAVTNELRMEMPTEMGPVTARVSIANKRPDAARPGSFRMGLQIVDMSRLDYARWGRLVAERSEA